MTDKDSITLPREVVQEALEALAKTPCNSVYEQDCTPCNAEEALRKALAALDAALAEPEKATMPTQYGWLCPACGRGNAPLAQTCPCRGWPTMQITCGPATMTGGT